MSVTPLKRLFRRLLRSPGAVQPAQEAGAAEELSPAQRASARAARQNPWLLAG